MAVTQFQPVRRWGAARGWARLSASVAAALLAMAVSVCAWTDISLNGSWRVCASDAAALPGAEAKWKTVEVPKTLERRPSRYLWYRRSFLAPSRTAQDRLFLCFGGVKFASRVWLNGRDVGGHVGGWEPFEVDVTSVARPGTNDLAVRVEDVRAVVDDPKQKDFHDIEQVREAVIAPIGSRPWEVGLWQGVSLSVRPDCHIDDVRVATSVRERRLAVTATLRNAGRAAAAGTLRVSALDEGRLALTLPPATATVAPGATGEVRLAAEWGDARLWSPQRPQRYTLRAEWQGTNGVSDERTVTFGFREFWTQGTQFILNGTPIRFLATAGHPESNSTKEDAIRLFRSIKQANCVAMRLHANVWPEWWYEAADEEGMLLIQESAIWCFVPQYALAAPEFWRNAADHWRGIVRRDANHPSIVMYSIENEILHCGGNRVVGCEARLAELGRLVKSLDPTRPIMYDGDEDPGGAADVINLHYPHEFPENRLYPDTCYWLAGRTRVSGYPYGEWEWSRKKPLYMGEFLWSDSTTPDPYTLFLGDAAYADYRLARARAKAEAWRMQILGYRASGVAGMCPWTLLETGPFPNPGFDAVRDAYAPLAAFLKEANARFFEGQTVTRTVFVFNDTPRRVKATLRWEVTARPGRSLEPDRGSLNLDLEPAGMRELTIRLPMPDVSSGGSADLEFLMRVEADGAVRHTTRAAWRLFPRRQALDRRGTKIAVYERGDRIRRFLESAGAEPVEAAAPWTAPPPASICVVGAGMLPAPAEAETPVAGLDDAPGDALREYVRAGGTLIVLEQPAYPPGLLPADLTDADCTIAFRRSWPGSTPANHADDLVVAPLQGACDSPSSVGRGFHPRLQGCTPSGCGDDSASSPQRGGTCQPGAKPLDTNRADAPAPCRGATAERVTPGAAVDRPCCPGVEDDAFKFWGDDHVVARRMLAKPSAGAFRTLVDAGGSGGLANVGALEARCGMGRYVLCQLRVEEKLDTEPAAGQFLAELVDAAAPPGAAPAAIGLMGKRLAADLAAAGVEWTPVAAPAASGPRGVALIDGETVPRLGRDGLAALRRWVEGGGRAVLHALTPETLAALGDALPRRLTLQPNGMLPVLIRRADGLIRGLSNQDLYWFGRATGKPHDPVPLSPEILDFAVADPLPPLDRCVVIEAETMTADESAPHAAADGMHLWRNGALSCDTNFGAGGRYVIGVFAGGTPLDGVFPEVSIALDGRRSAGVVLKQKETRLYVASLDAPPGRHRLSVAFVNDAYDPARHEDRNLFLDKVALAPAAGGESAILNPDALVRMPCGQGEFILDQIRWDGRTASSEPAARYLATLMVNLGAAFRDTVAGTLIPAVSMEPEPGLKLFSREGGCARFAANGSISRRVRFAADGEYRFEVVASGTPARDEYPAVRLSIDGKATAEDQLRSAGWQTLRYRAAVKAGEHEVTLTYFNDFWEPPEDRNLEIRELRLRAAENAGSH